MDFQLPVLRDYLAGSTPEPAPCSTATKNSVKQHEALALEISIASSITKHNQNQIATPLLVYHSPIQKNFSKIQYS